MAASELATNMRRTTEALVKAFDGQWSREAALAPRADECVHIVLPSSRKVPPKHNAEWSESFRPIESMGITGKMTIDDYMAVPDSTPPRTVCRSTFEGTTPVGPYKNDYIWWLTLNDKGDRITKIEEFYDTAAATEILGRFKEAGLV